MYWDQAFGRLQCLARVIEITFPDTLDAALDPVCEIGIQTWMNCVPVECVAGGKKAVQALWVDSIFTGPLQVTEKISITETATALYWTEVGHIQHRMEIPWI